MGKGSLLKVGTERKGRDLERMGLAGAGRSENG